MSSWRVRTIDDRVAGGRVVLRLCAQLASEELEDICAERDGCQHAVLVEQRPAHIGTGWGWEAHSGGRSSAFARSTLLTTFVLMPLPRPSICGAHGV